MVGTDWTNVELVEPKGTGFLLIQLIELGGDIVEVFLQLEPVFIRNQQVLPYLLRFTPTLTQLLNYRIRLLPKSVPKGSILL